MLLRIADYSDGGAIPFQNCHSEPSVAGGEDERGTCSSFAAIQLLIPRCARDDKPPECHHIMQSSIGVGLLRVSVTPW